MRFIWFFCISWLLVAGCAKTESVPEGLATASTAATSTTVSLAPTTTTTSAQIKQTTSTVAEATLEPSSTTVLEPVVTAPPRPPNTPGPDRETFKNISVSTMLVGTAEQAVDLAFHPGSTTALLAQRIGTVINFTGDTVGQVVIDLRPDLSMVGESGLLSITYDPSGTYLYVSYINADNDTRITAYAVDQNGLPTTQEPEIIFSLDQPENIHNGGHIRFGFDEYLYVALGDGGPANDPEDRAQRLDTLFGKILRINPQPGSQPAYTTPEDNPFVGVEGAKEEIWAYGLRNPWRFSFDRANDDFWLGDVGQYVVEEINWIDGQTNGANFGWARWEGPISRGPNPADHSPPLSFYNHDDGRCAVVGGFVYRGTAIPELVGAYIYGDFCDGTIRALTQVDGEVEAKRSLGISAGQLTSFAQDEDGELYTFNLAGEVHKIVPR